MKTRNTKFADFLKIYLIGSNVSNFDKKLKGVNHSTKLYKVQCTIVHVQCTYSISIDDLALVAYLLMFCSCRCISADFLAVVAYLLMFYNCRCISADVLAVVAYLLMFYSWRCISDDVLTFFVLLLMSRLSLSSWLSSYIYSNSILDIQSLWIRKFSIIDRKVPINTCLINSLFRV